MPSNYNIGYDNKTKTIIYKNIEIKQDANTFLNNNYQYRIPQVSGSFTLQNNHIINNYYKLNYNIGSYCNYLNNTSNVFEGSINDFTLIMNASDWSNFIDLISHDTSYDGYDGGNAYLHYLNIFNSNII